MSSKLWLPTWGLEQASVSHAAAVQSDPGAGFSALGHERFSSFPRAPRVVGGSSLRNACGRRWKAVVKTAGAPLNVCPVRTVNRRRVKSRMPIPAISGAGYGSRLLARRQVPDGRVHLLPIGAAGRREVRGFIGPPTYLPWFTAS
jgi:hypothetical protein